MNPEWLCYVNGQEYGPYTWPQLVQMAAAGNVVPATHVRRNFDSQWYQAEHVPGLFSPALAATNPKQAARPATAPRASASGISTKKVPAGKPATRPVASADELLPPATPIVQHPIAVPKGRVVAPSAAPKAAPAPAAVESAPAWIPVVKADEAPGQVHISRPEDKDSPVAGKKTDNSRQMVLMLGGTIGGVALVGLLLLVWKFTASPEEPKSLAAAPVVVIPTAEVDPNVGTGEVNPAGAEVNPIVTPTENTKPGADTPAKPLAKGEKPGATKTNASPATAPAAILKKETVWKPIEKFARIGVKPGLACTKVNVWVAADAAGRRVTVRSEGGPVAAGEAVDPGAAASVAPVPEGTAPEVNAPPAIIAAPPVAAGPVRYVAAEPASFLFIEVTINNADAKPRNYAGWNNESTAALLVDIAGKPFTLVAATATPNVKRLASKELQPGETVQDTLVFAIPPTAELHFRLALPQPALASTKSGAWQYEITGTALATPVAATAGVIGGNGDAPAPLVPRSSTTIPIPGLQEPAPAPKPVEPLPAEVPKPEVKPQPTERIPIPGLTDVPNNDKPAGPKKPDEVPNLVPPPAKKK